MTVFLETLWCSIKRFEAPYVYDLDPGIALLPMQRNWSSFQVDLGYTKLFHIPAVTSVSF